MRPPELRHSYYLCETHLPWGKGGQPHTAWGLCPSSSRARQWSNRTGWWPPPCPWNLPSFAASLRKHKRGGVKQVNTDLNIILKLWREKTLFVFQSWGQPAVLMLWKLFQHLTSQTVLTWALIYKAVLRIHTKNVCAHKSQKWRAPKNILIYKTVHEQAVLSYPLHAHIQPETAMMKY